MLLREISEPFPLGGSFSAIAGIEEGEMWTPQAVRGLIGQTVKVNLPSGISGDYQVVDAELGSDGQVELWFEPASNTDSERDK